MAKVKRLEEELRKQKDQLTLKDRRLEYMAKQLREMKQKGE